MPNTAPEVSYHLSTRFCFGNSACASGCILNAPSHHPAGEQHWALCVSFARWCLSSSLLQLPAGDALYDRLLSVRAWPWVRSLPQLVQCKSPAAGGEAAARPDGSTVSRPAAQPVAACVRAAVLSGMCLEFLALFQLAHFDFTRPHILVRGLLN